MKAETYIFGKFADGYSQYPENYSRDFFEAIGKSRRAESEIIFHREGSLTYYIYTREIAKQDKTFIGLCYVFNDILITDFASLFLTFEDIITNIVFTGELLEFTDNGQLSSKINHLYTHTKELQRISDYMNSKLLSLGRNVEKLPPVNYAISNAEWKDYSYNDFEEVKKAIIDYSNVRIIKGENYNSETLTSYSGKLRSLNQEKHRALQIVDQQKQEIDNLKKAQKNYKLVIWLFLIISIGSIIFLSVINNREQQIKRLDSELTDKQITIYNLEDQISDLQSECNSLSHKNDVLKKDKINLTQSLDSANEKISNLEGDKESLSREISNLRQQLPKTYEVYGRHSNRAYCYYKSSNGEYYQTGDTYSDYTNVTVYYKNKYYALTKKGYVKLEDLR